MSTNLEYRIDVLIKQKYVHGSHWRNLCYNILQMLQISTTCEYLISVSTSA